MRAFDIEPFKKIESDNVRVVKRPRQNDSRKAAFD